MLASPDLWVAVGLLIFLGLALWKGLKPALSSLDQRSERIRKELEEAQGLREEAQHQLAEYKRKQRDAMGEAEQIVEHAKEEAERMRKQAEEDLKAQLRRREQQAMDKIEQAEQAALREVQGQAVDLAVAAARKLLDEKLTKKQAEKLVDNTIGEVEKKLT